MTETHGYLCVHTTGGVGALPMFCADKSALQTHVNSLPLLDHNALIVTKIAGMMF